MFLHGGLGATAGDSRKITHCVWMAPAVSVVFKEHVCVTVLLGLISSDMRGRRKFFFECPHFRNVFEHSWSTKVLFFEWRQRKFFKWFEGFVFECCATGQRDRTGHYRTGHYRTDRQTHRQTDRQTDRQTGRQAGRQAGRQTDRKTDRQTYTALTGGGACMHFLPPCCVTSLGPYCVGGWWVHV